VFFLREAAHWFPFPTKKKKLPGSDNFKSFSRYLTAVFGPWQSSNISSCTRTIASNSSTPRSNFSSARSTIHFYTRLSILEDEAICQPHHSHTGPSAFKDSPPTINPSVRYMLVWSATSSDRSLNVAIAYQRRTYHSLGHYLADTQLQL